MTDDQKAAFVDYMRGRPCASMNVNFIMFYGPRPADYAEPTLSDAGGVLEALDKPLAPPRTRRPRKMAQDDA